jgi:hypothetical protein
MASELANYSTTPTRYFSDGATVPTSPQDVKTLHNDFAQSPLLNPSRVSEADRQNDATVGPRAIRSQGAAQANGELSTVRQQVRDAATGAQVDAEIKSFDARNEITRNADGTVGTRKSQVAGNMRQIRDDVTNVVESAKEVWEGASVDAEKERKERDDRIANSELVRSREATKEIPTMLPPSGRKKK